MIKLVFPLRRLPSLSLEALGAAVSTEEGRAASRLLLEDERNFIDHAASPLWFAEERPVVDA